MMDKLQIGDVIQVKFPLWQDWVAYVRAEAPSLLRGLEYDYLIRFAHRRTGLYRFLRCDLSGPESDAPWPMPFSQTQGRMTERVTYLPEEGIPQPPPLPEPLPEPLPPPPPEPQPEPAIKMRIEESKGMALIVGDWIKPGVTITLIDPWNNSYQAQAGSKPGYGPGGFEFIPWGGEGIYVLIAGGNEFRVPMAGKFTRLIFKQGEEEMVRLASAPMDEARARRILVRYPALGFEIVVG